MRTQDEIVTRIEEREKYDLFGFETSEYIVKLDFAHARPFLNEEATEQKWATADSATTGPLECLRGYMNFAWDKANHKRGISANRSILHCVAWLWLAEEDEILAEVEHMYDTDYHSYGKPILETICDHFGWDWSQWDNGDRTNG